MSNPRMSREMVTAIRGTYFYAWRKLGRAFRAVGRSLLRCFGLCPARKEVDGE